jgi:hypothetical protein
MQALRLWSSWRVLLVSAGWMLLCVLVAGAWLAFQFRGLWTATSSGSGGIGAVSISLNAIMLVIPLGPPIILIVAWLIARSS